MPTTCIVVGCGSRSNRDQVSFFAVAALQKNKFLLNKNVLSKKRRERWLAAIKRDDLTELKLKYQAVCSKHFITGKPAALEDENHPDWVPSQFMGHTSQATARKFGDVDRTTRFEKRRKVQRDDVTIFSYQEITPGAGVYDCWATFEQEWGERTYVIWYSVSIFIIPLIVLVYTYTCICKEIWQSSESSLRPRSSQKLSNKRTPFISRAKINTVKQTVAVIVMYIICSTPFIVGQLWATIDPHNPFLDGPVFTILMLMYSLNSCVNPWIYLAFNRELPRLLLRHYTASTKNYRAAAGGQSPSNSSGEVQTTSLRPFSKWSRYNGNGNSDRPPKFPGRSPNHRPYYAQYAAQQWIVTTST